MQEVMRWFIFWGVVLLVAAFSTSFMKRVPLTAGIVYFLIGIGAGPYGLELLNLDAFEHAKWLEHLTEIAVVSSLFTAGLKLHWRSTSRLWKGPLSLAVIGMIVSVGLISLTGNFFLSLSWGAAILLGGILSPTDPVLASDVQVEKAHDSDRLRFTLTGEGCLNDGTAFPFVMLGLGLLALHNLGDFGTRWVLVDVLWASVGGLAIGFILGRIVGQIVLYLRSHHKEQIDADEFLALGLIAMSYGTAVAFQAYGFLAVFAAGFALRSLEKKKISQRELTRNVEKAATDETTASAYIPHAVLGFNKQLERIFEILVVILLGSLFRFSYFNWQSIVFALALLFIIRPISAWLSVGRMKLLNSVQTTYILWFGVRGVGSLYYYFYAVNKGLDKGVALNIFSILFCSIVFSLFAHGVSVTPLMNLYEKRRKGTTKGIAPAEA
ncbi:MAG TPA: sodium:proton antiporter [Oligoflexus sp.]|uniref:cation:proton antiporter n=1 Tax=Oligoflexus sp. TaxID=1971216 RepID=UPI002D6CACFB|nr:sodium:proton antiporter [Oligoflexus sp.]HYX35927.1 sodium:proton antiporter [Oligoflexus sp.]